MNVILASLESIWQRLVAEEHKLAGELRDALDSLRSHPAVQASTQDPQAVVAAVIGSPSSPAPAAIDWSQYPTVQEAILRLQGHGLGVDEITAGWAAAHPGSDPSAVPAPGVDPNGAQNSDGPLASFTKAYDRGRFTFTADALSASVPVVAPSAGTFHFAHSGRGGAPGGDISATLTLSVEGGSGAAFTATEAGQQFTLHMSADKPTVEDVTMQPGAA
jgi:hypothetical protein